MVMRERCSAWVDFGDRQAFDVVAAAREQPDDARENAGSLSTSTERVCVSMFDLPIADE